MKGPLTGILTLVTVGIPTNWCNTVVITAKIVGRKEEHLTTKI